MGGNVAALKLFLLAPLASFLAFWFVPAPPRDPPIVSVLCYHTFDSPKKTPYTVTRQTFREQMRYLHVQHIPVIPLPQLIDYLHKGDPIPDHSVVVSIDDGYKTARTKAWPVMKEFGFPFTVFVYPHFIGHASALTWEDLEVMTKEGVDVEGHSLTHPLLTHPGKAMNRKDYLAWIDQELQESKSQIEAHLRKQVTALAYPFGGYNELIVERTRRAGYQGAFTCDDGNVDRFTDPLRINRRLVYRGVRLREFANYFRDSPLHLANLSPRDGEHVRGPVSLIRGRVRRVQEVLAGSSQILVDKLGKRYFRVAIDPKTGVFSISSAISS